MFGKNSKRLREAATSFVKGLWDAANPEYKAKIFNILIAKIPYLHSYGIKAVEFFTLIIHILKEGVSSKSAIDSSIKMEDVFSFVKESLSKANNKISSHQNLELYSSIYSLVGGRKPASSVFSDYGYNAKLVSAPERIV